MNTTQILNEVINLQAHFAEGLKIATGLRQKLEGNATPSSSRKGQGLSPEHSTRIITKRLKTALKQKSI